MQNQKITETKSPDHRSQRTINFQDTYTFTREGTVYVIKDFKHFIKNIDFSSLEAEMNAIDSKLIKANPDYEINFSKLDNTPDLFISQLKALPSSNLLSCNEIGEPINLQTMVEFRIKVASTTMFADHVIINKGKVSCTIHSVIWTDLSCIKQLYNTALIFNLITPTNNTREYFSRLINLQLDNTVLYVMVNATHLCLDNSNSYIICRKLSVNSSDVSNFNVMRTKHFSSLSTLLMRWVDTLNKKYSLEYFGNLYWTGLNSVLGILLFPNQLVVKSNFQISI